MLQRVSLSGADAAWIQGRGYTLSPFYEHATPVSATDITSAICDNIGADDLYNPAVLNMRLAGRQLTTAYMLP